MISNTVRFRLDLIFGETECGALLIYFFSFFSIPSRCLFSSGLRRKRYLLEFYLEKIAHFYISKLV